MLLMIRAGVVAGRIAVLAVKVILKIKEQHLAAHHGAAQKAFDTRRRLAADAEAPPGAWNRYWLCQKQSQKRKNWKKIGGFILRGKHFFKVYFGRLAVGILDPLGRGG